MKKNGESWESLDVDAQIEELMCLHITIKAYF